MAIRRQQCAHKLAQGIGPRYELVQPANVVDAFGLGAPAYFRVELCL
jgi:hypothetical protein